MSNKENTHPTKLWSVDIRLPRYENILIPGESGDTHPPSDTVDTIESSDWIHQEIREHIFNHVFHDYGFSCRVANPSNRAMRTTNYRHDHGVWIPQTHDEEQP